MRVCHILSGYYPGYPDPYEYTRKLAELGVSVDAVAWGRPAEARDEWIDGVHVRRIPRTTAKQHPPSTLKGAAPYTRAVLETLRDQQYDLIHVYAFRGCMLLPLLGRKLTDHWLLDIRTGSVASSRLRAELANRATALESRFYRWQVALGEEVGRKVLGRDSNFTVIPLGADMKKFCPEQAGRVRAQLGLNDQQTVVVYSGSLAPQRRLEHVIRGFARVAANYPSLHMLIVGDGAALDGLQRLACELGVAERIVFPGYIHYDQIQNYVADADIGLAYVPITPQYDHQPPLKTVEYLACGLATLATRTQGNLEFVRDGENALLIDDSAEAVAAGFTRLMEDVHLRQSLAAQARPSVEKYDWRLIVRDRLLPLYQRILQSKAEVA